MSSALRRSICSAALVLCLLDNTSAQILNAGFESWASGDPVSWYTNNGLYTFVTQSADVHGGSAAAQGAVVNVGALNLSPALNNQDNSGKGCTVSGRSAALHGFYKFSPVSGDVFYVNALAQVGTSGVGSAAFVEVSAQATYKEFVADFIFPGSDVPDNVVISFSIGGLGGLPHVGSTFVVDDLAFGPATGLAGEESDVPAQIHLGQNYPNPFNPTTSVVYEIPERSHVSLTVLDLLGRVVQVLVNEEQTAGKYKAIVDAAALPSGVYLYRLASGGQVETKKMTLLR